METKELEIEIAQGQMSFMFDDIDFDDKEEESSVLSNESLIKPQNHEWIKEEVLFVVVKAQNRFLSNDLPSLKLCGKKMIDWVRLAGADCEQTVIDESEDILDRVRNIDTDKKYIAIFYSDTPLFNKASFYRIMDYFSSKSINFLQLTRGYVVKTEFLKNSPRFMQGATGGFEADGLMQADSAKTISYMQSFLNNKILSFHENNGVVILGKNTVFIDADVEIENGVLIEPNNIIQGESVIASGTTLASGNIIKNSIISNNCTISASYIEKSKISQGKVIKPYSKIIEEEL